MSHDFSHNSNLTNTVTRIFQTISSSDSSHSPCVWADVFAVPHQQLRSRLLLMFDTQKSQIKLITMDSSCFSTSNRTLNVHKNNKIKLGVR